MATPELKSSLAAFVTFAGTLTIRLIGMLLQYHGLGDLYRIYAVSQRDGTDFKLACVPSTYKTPHREDFEPGYMWSLYDFGYGQTAAGYRWSKQPPMLVGEDEARAKVR